MAYLLVKRHAIQGEGEVWFHALLHHTPQRSFVPKRVAEQSQSGSGTVIRRMGHAEDLMPETHNALGVLICGSVGRIGHAKFLSRDDNISNLHRVESKGPEDVPSTVVYSKPGILVGRKCRCFGVSAVSIVTIPLGHKNTGTSMMTTIAFPVWLKDPEVGRARIREQIERLVANLDHCGERRAVRSCSER